MLAALVSLRLPTLVAQSGPTFAADRLVDSVGINIHLHYLDTLYGDFELVRLRLRELGVRHVRDGLIDTAWLPYYDRHNALGADGLRGIYIAAPGVPDAVLRAYPQRLHAIFAGYEAPNEYDLSGDPAWPRTLRDTLVRLRALRQDPRLAGYPLHGPSLTDEAAYAALGDVSALVDTVNLHNYPGGRNPGTGGWGDRGYGSIPYHLNVVRSAGTGKPIVTTETGYWDDLATVNAVPEHVSARYFPRLLLEQLRQGIQRTYLYELIDSPRVGVAGDSGYGLVRRDGSHKPAFHAVRHLLQLLSDPGPAFTVQPLDYVVSGAGGDLRTIAFRKRSGSYFLALWIERPAYEVDARQLLSVPPEVATIRFAANAQIVRTIRWNSEGLTREEPGQASSRTAVVGVTDSITVLEVRVP